MCVGKCPGKGGSHVLQEGSLHGGDYITETVLTRKLGASVKGWIRQSLTRKRNICNAASQTMSVFCSLGRTTRGEALRVAHLGGGCNSSAMPVNNGAIQTWIPTGRPGYRAKYCIPPVSDYRRRGRKRDPRGGKARHGGSGPAVYDRVRAPRHTGDRRADTQTRGIADAIGLDISHSRIASSMYQVSAGSRGAARRYSGPAAHGCRWGARVEIRIAAASRVRHRT